jgi:LysR family transcriptional regulator, low CO2-responsive transcriptional regulator
MTLHQLRIFAAVAKHKGMTKAARELELTQPTITHQLKFLQQEVGRLYRRTPVGIDLTETGQRFLDDLLPALQQIEAIAARYARRNGEHPPPLVIGGSNGPTAWFLPAMASRFQKSHPAVAVMLRVDSGTKLETMVQSGEVEVAVVTTRSKLPGLCYEPCRREELVFFAARGSTFFKAQLSIGDLAEVPLVLYKQGRAGAALKFLSQMQRAGVHPNIVMRAESIEAVKNAVREGSGIGMLYRDNLRSEIDSGEVHVIRVAGVDMRVASFIIYARKGRFSAAASAFLKLLRRRRRDPRPAAQLEERSSLAKVLALAPLWLFGVMYPLLNSLAGDAAVLPTAFF